MIVREFRGFGLTVKGLKNIPKWATESWPALVPLLLAVIHVCLAARWGFGSDETRTLNRCAAAALQVIGVVIILYSIDSSLREFDLPSLPNRFRKYLARFPLCLWRENATLSIHNLSHEHASSNILIKQSGAVTLEDRVSQLEANGRALELHVAEQERMFVGQLSEVENRISRRIGEAEVATQEFEGVIKRRTHDGVGEQIFGLLLVIHAAVAGYFA